MSISIRGCRTQKKSLDVIANMKQALIRRIDPTHKYKVREIVAKKLLPNKEGKPDRFLVYRLIRGHHIPARRSPFGMMEVLGQDLIDFIGGYYER